MANMPLTPDASSTSRLTDVGHNGNLKYRQLIDSGTAAPASLRQFALELWQQGRLTEARDLFTIIVGLLPNQPQLLAELGSLHLATGQTPEAICNLTSSLSLDPSQILVWINVATACGAAGEMGAAEKAFSTALELDPSSVEATTGLGLLYIRQTHYDLAANYLRGAIRRGLDTPSVYACLGQSLFLLGEFTDASTALRMAIDALPGEPQIVLKYAQVRLVETAISGTADEALRVYQMIAGEFAECIESVLNAAFQTLCGYGEKQAAIRIGTEILERSPNDAIISYQMDALRGRDRANATPSVIAASFDKYAETFDHHLVNVLGYKVPQQAYGMLAASGATFSRILDLGCGTGLAGPLLHSFGGQLTGVDLSPKMLERAATRGCYDRLIKSEAVDYLKSHDQYFDLVTAFDVLVYIGDVAPLIAATADRLVPGGILVFSLETSNQAPFVLMPTGRFSHSPGYVESVYETRFRCIASVHTVIRLEANKPVNGMLIMLQRK